MLLSSLENTALEANILCQSKKLGHLGCLSRLGNDQSLKGELCLPQTRPKAIMGLTGMQMSREDQEKSGTS